MSHRILYEEDIGVESPNKLNYEIARTEIIKKLEEPSLKNQNLIILGSREPNNNTTANLNEVSNQINNLNEILEKEDLLDNVEIKENHQQNVNTSSSNAKSRTSKIAGNNEVVKKPNKRTQVLGAKVLKETDRSQASLSNKIPYKKPQIQKQEGRVRSSGEGDSSSFQCPVCEQHFDSKVAIRNHVRYHTTPQQYKCFLCSLKFNKNADLIAHKSEHTEAFLCKMCKVAFSDHCDYLIHKLAHTSRTIFTCPECSLTYNSKHSYKNHIYTHFDKKLTCPICRHITNGETNLQNHLNLHKYKFTCVECGKLMKNKPSYDYHMSVHTGVKLYQCLYCGKGFRKNVQRIIHTRIHTGERPFSCDICGQKFRQSSNWTRHQTTHEKEKKFSCKVCGKKFSHKPTLSSHMDTHKEGKKRFECSECEASFMTIPALRVHIMYKHLKERPVECRFCNVRFINTNQLGRHKKTLYHRRNVYGDKLKKEKGGNN